MKHSKMKGTTKSAGGMSRRPAASTTMGSTKSAGGRTTASTRSGRTMKTGRR